VKAMIRSANLSEEQRKLVLSAIKVIARKAPTFLGIVAKCRIEAKDLGGTAYAATDGKRIFINFDMVPKDPETLASIILHEALHIALKHTEKARKHRYPGTFNIASDAVINYFISERLGLKLPPNVITPEWISGKIKKPVDEVKKMSAEELYWLLLRNGVTEEKTHDLGIPSGSSSDSSPDSTSSSNAPQSHDHQDEEQSDEDNGDSKREDEPSEEDVIIAIERWATIENLTKNREFDPIDDLRLLDVAGKVDWKRILRAKLGGLSREIKKSTWLRESRKLGEDAMGRIRSRSRHPRKIIVAVDVSGSIVAETNLLKEFAKEVVEIARQVQADIVLIPWGDTVYEVLSIPRQKVGDSTILAPLLKHAGRGTNVEPALQKIDEVIRSGKARYGVVLLTDGMFATTPKIQELAINVARRAEVAVYLYTVYEHPHVFSNWIRIKYSHY